MYIRKQNTSQKSIFKHISSSLLFPILLYIFLLSMVRPQIRQWVMITPEYITAFIQYQLFYLGQKIPLQNLYSCKKSMPKKSKRNMLLNICHICSAACWLHLQSSVCTLIQIYFLNIGICAQNFQVCYLMQNNNSRLSKVNFHLLLFTDTRHCLLYSPQTLPAIHPAEVATARAGLSQSTMGQIQGCPIGSVPPTAQYKILKVRYHNPNNSG